MDVLTGSLDGGAKESGLTGIPGFQAKEHFLWSGVDTGRERACLEGGGPRRDVVGPPTLNVEKGVERPSGRGHHIQEGN